MPTSRRTHPRRSTRTRALLALAATAATVGLVVSGGAAANASLAVTVINTGGSGVASRSAPRLNATNGYGAPANAAVTTVCWTWGDAVGSNGNRLWWLISYQGRQFYVDDLYVSTPNIANQPPAGQPQCGAQPAPAPAAVAVTPDENAWYTLTARNSSKVADVRGGAAADGTPVQQYTPNGSNPQKWRFVHTDGGYYRLVSALSGGRVLDVTGGTASNGTKVQTWTWGGGSNQQWAPFDAGNGYIVLKPRHVGRCLDVPGGSQSSGVQLQIWDCNGTSSQQFRLTSVGPVASSAGAGAVAWAARQNGQWEAPVDVRLWFPEWAQDGTIPWEWSGDCPKFVQAAWREVGRTDLKKAKTAANIWAAYGSPTNGATTAPAGALVFWPSAYGGIGHVALADGNGGVWSTVGHDGNRYPIGYRTIADIVAHGAAGWPSGPPTGWVMP